MSLQHSPQTPLGQRRGGNQQDGGCWSKESVVKCLTGQCGSSVGARHRGKSMLSQWLCVRTPATWGVSGHLVQERKATRPCEIIKRKKSQVSPSRAVQWGITVQPWGGGKGGWQRRLLGSWEGERSCKGESERENDSQVWLIRQMASINNHKHPDAQSWAATGDSQIRKSKKMSVGVDMRSEEQGQASSKNNLWKSSALYWTWSGEKEAFESGKGTGTYNTIACVQRIAWLWHNENPCAPFFSHLASFKPWIMAWKLQQVKASGSERRITSFLFRERGLQGKKIQKKEIYSSQEGKLSGMAWTGVAQAVLWQGTVWKRKQMCKEGYSKKQNLM